MIGAGSAIRLGFTQAFSRWATGFFCILVSIAEVFCGVILMLGFLAWLNGGARSGPIAIGAAVLGMLSARILLAFVHGGAIRQSAAWLEGRGTGTTLEEMFTAAPRSLGWFLWTLPIELLGALWKWVGLGALLFAYGRALLTRDGGFSASVTLAMFVTLALPLALGWALLRRAALIAAVRDELGPFAAASRGLSWIAARPGAWFAVLAVGVLAGAGAELVISMFGSAVSPEGGLDLIEPVIASELAGGVLVAFTWALFELVILFGFTALQSHPTPPPAPAPLPPAPDLPPPAVATPL